MTETAVLPQVPAHYRKTARPSWHQRRRHACVQRLLRLVPAGETLDYGCGYGDIAWAVSQTHSVRGVDVDPGRVAFAAREYAPIPFSVCAPDGLDFPDASFDLVTSVVVVHFVPDPEGYFREIRRVLRPGGRLLLVCQDDPAVGRAMRRWLGRGERKSDLWVRPRATVRQLIESLGFRIEADDYFYDPPLDNLKGLKALVPTLIEQVLSFARVKATSNYYAYLAVRS